MLEGQTLWKATIFSDICSAEQDAGGKEGKNQQFKSNQFIFALSLNVSLMSSPEAA